MKHITIYDLPITAPRKATKVYDNSSVVIYEDGETYYLADNHSSEPWECGTAEDVVEYFLQLAE